MLYPYDPIHVMACGNSPGNHDWAAIWPSQNFDFRLMLENQTMKLKKFLNKNLVLVFSVQ